MTVALRKASNTLVMAAQLYRDLAISASELFRPATYSYLSSWRRSIKLAALDHAGGTRPH